MNTRVRAIGVRVDFRSVVTKSDEDSGMRANFEWETTRLVTFL